MCTVRVRIISRSYVFMYTRTSNGGEEYTKKHRLHESCKSEYSLGRSRRTYAPFNASRNFMPLYLTTFTCNMQSVIDEGIDYPCGGQRTSIYIVTNKHSHDEVKFSSNREQRKYSSLQMQSRNNDP